MRPSTKFIKETLKGDLIGVEIGVFHGSNALEMLRGLKIKKLYLVDSYVKYWDETKFRYDDELDLAYKRARSITNDFKDKVVFKKLKSADASKLIPDELDFVYIDANHDYEHVSEDIKNYWEKIKKGGVFSGHDYEQREKKEDVRWGVTKAVDEFVKKNGLKLYVECDNDDKNPGNHDWWVIKP